MPSKCLSSFLIPSFMLTLSCGPSASDSRHAENTLAQSSRSKPLSCIIYDEYGLETAGIEDILEAKGFTITNEWPSTVEYFSPNRDFSSGWDVPGGGLQASIRCPMSSMLERDIWVETFTLWSSISQGYVADVSGNRYAVCENTTDLQRDQRRLDSLRVGARKLKSCDTYLKQLEMLYR